MVPDEHVSEIERRPLAFAVGGVQHIQADAVSETIDKLDTANSIETFFLERAKQLLKPGGIADIILPSSILSNGGTTYVRAREILLQSFDIVAIAKFGSRTFGNH